jgi:hypothetical protein
MIEEVQAEVPVKKIGFSWKRIGKIILFFLILAGILAGVWFAAMSRPVKIAWASVVLDNREHYLDCYSLPFYPQVEKALKEHADIAEKLKQLGAGEVLPQENKCKGWQGGIEFIKGDILIKYSSHSQRLAIEKLIGDNFFGIPYRGENH